MSLKLTKEQSDAIESHGKVIVSASAGSGKTFVMIQKLANLLVSGGDLDGILAVTFTKKAAGQMKEKLRSALIALLPTSDENTTKKIKEQLNKIPSADISTIHSFCSHLVRTYFYALDIDSSFDIIADDDSVAMTLKNRAMDNLFDRLYDEEDADFGVLLKSLRRKRSDDNIKMLLFETHKSVRMIADYQGLLSSLGGIYTEEGFERVCKDYKDYLNERYSCLLSSVEKFANNFSIAEGGDKYEQIFEEMKEALKSAIANEDIFAPLPKLSTTKKPNANDNTREASDQFMTFRDGLKRKYEGLTSDLKSKEEEKDVFLKSGALAVAFANILIKFDEEYTQVKRDEGKLDYNDLEHLTLKLLQDDEIKSQINAKYKYVFVDEYQDVNPVQEKIISEVGAHDVFTVGDVKQAIYGFRGSKSLFFAQKYNMLMDGDGQALKLSNNFRSSDGVINCVNKLFSRVMTSDVCGFDYKLNSIMMRGGGYPEGYGTAKVHIFKEEETEKAEASKIYSVAENAGVKSDYTAEAMAVLKIVRDELSKQHYDLKTNEYVDTQPGDICILTRKRIGKSVMGIVRALTDAGYSVAGAKQSNICDRTEVRQMLDILSYIDNCQQDIPLASALLSPVGGFNEEELSLIKIAQTPQFGEKPTFRECAVSYASTRSDELAHKLAKFFRKIYDYRRLSDIVGVSKLIDKIMTDSGLSARYASDGGEKLESIKRLAEEAYSPTGELSLNAFLNKIKAGGYKINAPVPSSSESIKVMTMHASKGLEFPVVIIADISATFKGREYSEMPFDDVYGFAPKYYDESTRLQYKTLLARLCKVKLSREEIKNELNLFYVACTRAMCNLYIMTGELKEYDQTGVLTATNYAQFCDPEVLDTEYIENNEDIATLSKPQLLMTQPDEKLTETIKEHFMPTYEHSASVDLPVKSSASQLLQMSADDAYYAENVLFPEDEGDENGAETKEANSVANLAEVGKEAGVKHEKKSGGKSGKSSLYGTAYHRFLQLCDFAIKDRKGIAREVEEFVGSGLMPTEQAELLSIDNLVDILAMKAFDNLSGATLYREREFLCTLPASSFLNTTADDGVLFQGAIDLLAIGSFGTAIIDYKYSTKTDEELIEKYSAQLALYKKAVSAILKIDEKNISTTIINIRKKREIPLK